MPTTVSSNPFPLGFVKPGATFATISVPITQNFTDLATSAPYGQVDSIYVHALAGNSTVVFLLNTVAAPDVATYLNVVDVIAAGSSTSISSGAMNTLALSQFYIGALNSGDGAIVTVKFR